MADFCFLIGLFCLCLASLCSILALSLDKWETGDIDFHTIGPIRIDYVSVQAGLWHEYRTLHRSSIFLGIPDNSTSQMYTVEREINLQSNAGVMLLIMRILLFVSSFSLVGAVTCVVLKTKVYKTVEYLATASWMLSCEAGALLMTSFVIYMEGIKAEGTNFDGAFYLDIVGWILAWIAACLLFMSSRTFRNLVND